MYASVKRNDGAQPHNRDAWKVAVHDADEQWDDILYDHTFIQGIAIEEQLVARLGPYTASPADVIRDGAGYRIENVRLRD